MESMESTSDRRAQNYRPTMVQEFVHLSALNSFAVVQPILNSLVNNVAFLRYYDYSPAAVLLAVVLLTLGIPATFLSLRVVLHRLGYPKFADVIRTILMVVLMLLALLYAARILARVALEKILHGFGGLHRAATGNQYLFDGRDLF